MAFNSGQQVSVTNAEFDTAKRKMYLLGTELETQ